MNATLKAVARRVVPGWVRDWRANRFRARVERATARLSSLAGGRVLAGPFKGMRYVTQSHCSQLGPKLLGSYERELASLLDQVGRIAPDRIVDAGAAEGYYAVGLLVRFPGARIMAFEAEQAARAELAALARLNGVEDRLEVRGFCDVAALEAALAGATRPLVIMDIEGGEAQVLDPRAVPSLARAWVLVELHPHFVEGLERMLRDRFLATHRVHYIAARDRRRAELPDVPPLGARDLLAAAWEARPDGQGWYWLEPMSAD